MILNDAVAERIMKIYEDMYMKGELLSQAQLTMYYQTFQAKFGPEQLASMDGYSLLEFMHNISNRDSLVYWLEFKDDEEFPTKRFGSIHGGTNLKYGVYLSKERNTWVTGSSRKIVELSVEEAIAIARRHRDQLLKGADLLDKLPADAGDEDYLELQIDMNEQAPDVSDTAWGHKYFSLLFPDKLDCYHVPDYQRAHLIRMGVFPPPQEGRYVIAGRYVAITRQLGIHINHLMAVLNKMNGRPYRYWRIGTSDGTKPRNRWDLMREGNCVAVGFSKIEDLSDLTYDKKSHLRLKEIMHEKYPTNPAAEGRAAQQLFNFFGAISENDLVIAADGGTVIGIGRVTGDYYYDPSSDFPHRRPVEWLSFDEWKLPEAEGLQTTVYELKKPQNLIEIERILFKRKTLIDPVLPKKKTILEGLPGRIQAVLERKSQVILYGPPGTGKTYWAEITARELAAHKRFGKAFSELSAEEQEVIFGQNGLVQLCSFHPSYGYEDFMEGYRPRTQNGQMVFELQDGIFKRLCLQAQQNPELNYYLIIDEINRGDIPRIFGELLTVLEKNKRGKKILLPLSRQEFSVPPNVYIIGTMNTADRSIALLDTALRRRFGFIELMPDTELLKDAVVDGIPLGSWLHSLNNRICQNIGRDARNLQIGHAYLMEKDRPIHSLPRLMRVVQEDIIPLLEEYCYEDYKTLELILGSVLVDAKQQRIRHELFEPGREDAFIEALLEHIPELTIPEDRLVEIDDLLENDIDEQNSD
jgi:5-methylcytosine-specific restriction protein B